MNPLQWFIDRGRAEGSPTFTGPRTLHYAVWVAIGTSVLYFTLQLDKILGRKAGRVARAVRG